MADNLWYKDAVFYELYVRAFYDSNGDGQGDLPGVIARLDYLRDLGVTCIWLLPVCDSPLVDDGYDVRDYRQIMAEYGTLADFKRLVEEAHQRGIRVITDLVLNHTSEQHYWFQQARSSRDNPYRDWYVWSDTDQQYPEAGIIFIDSQTSNWTLDPASGQYYWHRFYPQQPDLNYDNPAVQQAMLNIADYWLALGTDGFRCDAVPYLFIREGTNGENLPETHSYLKRLRATISARYPEAILIGEANQSPELIVPYIAGDEFQMVFNFPLMNYIFYALQQQVAAPIQEVLAATPPIGESSQWCNFLRNHDELSLEMVPQHLRDLLNHAYGPLPEQRINWGIRRRLAPLLDNDQRRIELANALLFSLPGSPIIYYGDEIGMGDDVSLFDRNGVRTPMQWSAAANGGFSTASQTYAPAIDDVVYGYQRVNLAAQLGDPASLYNRMRQMIAARKSQPAFGRGTIRFYPTGHPAALVFEREYEGQRILCLHNLGPHALTVPLPASLPAQQFTPLLGGGLTAAGVVMLPAFGYCWLLLGQVAGTPLA